jgi:hypothetical protein
MKYFKDDKQITKEHAYNLLKQFVKYKFKQDFADYACDAMFTHPRHNSMDCEDEFTGERFVISSKAEDYKPEIQGKQLNLF